MRKAVWILTIFVSIGLAPSVMSATTTTATYDAIYVFGDSYCDVGNIFLATAGAEPAAPYYNGRFSNGPIWIEHVAGGLGLPMKPSLAGGTDYAFGGAFATAPQSISGGTIPSVPQQVELYLSQHGGKADPKALYIIEGGGNDILGATGGSPVTLGFKVATALAESELLLRRAGAKHFVVPNLFDVGLLPAGQANATFDHAAVVAANKYLNDLLALEDALEGISILRLDVYSLLESVKTDPTHYGFTDITDPCLTTVICADPDHTLFWDTHHPTVFGHDLFAVSLETVLSQQK
ncbi:SGNH/GDSL hydrolase family protein [Acidicapsa ligni]|uniref:SGNH/GDSL hydrolase family protein n=1 Tax=Acidicapsa ligni TaxID=542300 RepID=UPI0021DF4FF6|nr:SGNH/GDSL hydrolase family protein [Acidicapsa ligni]